MFLTQSNKLLSIGLLTSSLLIAGFNAPVLAQTSQEKGLAIAVEADKRDIGFGDSTANLEMILRNKYGEETKRVMRNKTLEQMSDGDKALIVLLLL